MILSEAFIDRAKDQYVQISEEELESLEPTGVSI
jgi:predicted O-methyltransferase YrrM